MLFRSLPVLLQPCVPTLRAAGQGHSRDLEELRPENPGAWWRIYRRPGLGPTHGSSKNNFVDFHFLSVWWGEIFTQVALNFVWIFT